MPGWTDSLAAAGGLAMAFILGLCTNATCYKKNIADVIPVDYVSNAIIVAAAKHANNPSLRIVMVGTSTNNPISWY
jgi:hypothetical protein